MPRTHCTEVLVNYDTCKCPLIFIIVLYQAAYFYIQVTVVIMQILLNDSATKRHGSCFGTVFSLSFSFSFRELNFIFTACVVFFHCSVCCFVHRG